MAGDGAVLLTEDGQRFESMPPKGKVVNSVGAGDSMVAGFLAGYMEEHDYAKAFYMGLCAGKRIRILRGTGNQGRSPRFDT